MDRRELIKALGVACGGVFLTACGGGGPGIPGIPSASSLIPPNYRFVSLLKSSQLLPGIGKTLSFVGAAQINALGQFAFLGRDTRKRSGLYMGRLNWADLYSRLDSLNALDTSALTGFQKILEPGDVLPDRSVTAKVESFALSESGSLFMRVMNTRGEHGLFVQPLTGTMQRLVGYGDALPGGVGRFAHCMGDFEAHDDDSLVMVSHFLGNKHHGQGLFHLPRGSVAGGRRIASTLDTLPNSPDKISMFGLVDTNGRDCAHQVFIHPQPITVGANAGTAARQPGNALLVAPTADTMMVSKISAISAAVTLPASMRASARSGETHHGPRQNRAGQVAGVVTEGQVQTLHIDGITVLSTGQQTPTGRTIGGLLGPIPGVGDQFFIVAQIEPLGCEILVTNGRDVRSVAFDGQRIGNFEVEQFGLGGVRNQIDSTGRFVCAVKYRDQRTGLVAAIPVGS